MVGAAEGKSLGHCFFWGEGGFLGFVCFLGGVWGVGWGGGASLAIFGGFLGFTFTRCLFFWAGGGGGCHFGGGQFEKHVRRDKDYFGKRSKNE